MRNILKSTFFWQFAGGFALGAIGVVSLTPADTLPVSYAAPVTQQATR